MDTKLVVSSSPHIRADEDSRSLMFDVLVALGFSLPVAVYFFGFRVLALCAVSVASCVGFEWLYCRLMKRPNRIYDLSAAVTGLLISYVLPVTVPYWLLILASFFAIVIVKQLYGGIGKNFLNPALAARAFLTGFTQLSDYVAPGGESRFSLGSLLAVDAVSQATPLTELGNTGSLPLDISWMNMLLGQISGCIGEISSLVLLLGGLYLVVRKVITPRIPLAFLATAAILFFVFPADGLPRLEYMGYNLLSGGLILGAVFMATDYSTSPVTPMGQWFFGIGCALLTVLFRYFSPMPEGVCYAILLMNTVAWVLDKVSLPRRFGGGKRRHKVHD